MQAYSICFLCIYYRIFHSLCMIYGVCNNDIYHALDNCHACNITSCATYCSFSVSDQRMDAIKSRICAVSVLLS